MPDLTSIRARVRSLTGVRSAALVTDADVDAFINDTYHEVNDLHDWPFLEVETTLALTDGDRVVSVPAGFRTARQVVLVIGDKRYELEERPEAMTAQWDNATEGIASRFVIDDDEVQLDRPVPEDATLELSYSSLPVPLAAGGDTPVWPVQFHNALEYGAAARLLSSEGDDSDRIQAFNMEYSSTVARMRRRLLTSVSRTSRWAGGTRPRRRGPRSLRRRDY